MSWIPICLALLDASESCKRELARRILGEVRVMEWEQTQSHAWLDGVDVIAVMGTTLDLGVLERCMHTGKHVFVAAKACRSEPVRQLLASQIEAGANSIHIGNPVASLPSRQVIWDRFQHGKLGQPGLIRVHRWNSATQDLEEDKRLPLDLLYEIDLVLRYFSENPQQIFATRYAADRGAAIHLKWTNGAMALIEFTADLPTPNAYTSFSVIGSRGSAYADDHPNAQLLFQRETLGLMVPEVTNPETHMLTSYLTCFGDSSSGLNVSSSRSELGRSKCDTRVSWNRAMLVAKAITRSLESGAAVELQQNSEN